MCDVQQHNAHCLVVCMWFEGGVHGLERKEFFFQLPAGSFGRGITNADLFFFFTVHTATQPLRTNVTNKSSTIPTPHFPCHLHMFTCFFIVSSNFSRARFPPLNIIFPSLLRRESSPVAAILFFFEEQEAHPKRDGENKKMAYIA